MVSLGAIKSTTHASPCSSFETQVVDKKGSQKVVIGLVWFSARKVGIMSSVIVGYGGQLPSLPKQWQLPSQIGTTFLDKTVSSFACTGIFIIESN